MLKSGMPYVKKPTDTEEHKTKIVPDGFKTNEKQKSKVIPDENKTFSEDPKKCRIVPGKPHHPESPVPPDGGLTVSGKSSARVVPDRKKTERKIYS